MAERFFPERVVGELGKYSDKEFWRIADRLYALGREKGDCFFVRGEDFMNAAAADGLMPFFEENDILRFGTLAHAVASWRPTKDVARFDAELYRTLIGAEFRGVVPGEILRRLPAWSVYIETPEGFERNGLVFPGFFATLFNDSQLSLVFAADDEELSSMTAMIHLDGDISGEFGHLDNSDNFELKRPGQDSAMDRARKMIGSALSLVVYLCSYGFGDGQKYHDGTRSAAAAKRVKKELRVFAAEKVSLRRPGSFFAEKIREGIERERNARESSPSGAERAPVRPHMRRAHMHKHRIGPGRADVVMKFHLPVMCALHNADKIKSPRM